MNELMNKSLFFVKEHVGIFKASNNYDVLDPETNAIIMQCREENLGMFTKLLRFTDFKTMTPFDIEVKAFTGEKVLSVSRGVTWFLSEVKVYDGKDKFIGKFKQKLFSIGGSFAMFDANDKYICDVKGKWSGWGYKFLKEDKQFAGITKKWAGIGKELFTTADNYMISIEEIVPPNHPMRLMVIAAALCIDMVLKEK